MSASVSSRAMRPRGMFLSCASTSRQAASAFSRPSTVALRLGALIQPASRGIVAVVLRIGELLHLLIEPFAAPVLRSRARILEKILDRWVTSPMAYSICRSVSGRRDQSVKRAPLSTAMPSQLSTMFE
jgi:hypothetical protein